MGWGPRLAGLPALQGLRCSLLSLQVLVLGEKVVKNPQGGFEIQVHHICGRKRRRRWRGESTWALVLGRGRHGAPVTSTAECFSLKTDSHPTPDALGSAIPGHWLL